MDKEVAKNYFEPATQPPNSTIMGYCKTFLIIICRTTGAIRKKKIAKAATEEALVTSGVSEMPVPSKFIKNPKKTNMLTLDTDTVTYRRQRRPGVHFGDA